MELTHKKLFCERYGRSKKLDVSDFILWFESHPKKDELLRSSKTRIQNIYKDETGNTISHAPIASVLKKEYIIVDNKIYKLYAVFDEEQE